MKRKNILAAFAFTAAALLFYGKSIPPASAAVYSESTVQNETAVSIRPIPSYNLSNYLKDNSFLTATDNGFMRVFYDGEKIVIEYYNDNFDVTFQKTLDMELDTWGGFYKGSHAYYIIEGKNNLEEDDTAEVFRVIQYDTDWNRLGAANISGDGNMFGAQVRYPFDYGCVNAAEYNGMLYIVTGHEGYVDDRYGQGHQGFLMLSVDESTMEGKIVDADLWHSFAQYIDNDNSDLYVLEQSEGSRYTKLSKYNANALEYDDSVSIPILQYGGVSDSAWSIPCYASVDGMALSSENVLCLGTSIDQAEYDNYSSDTAYNIYLTITPMTEFSEESTTVKWLTDYQSGKRFVGTNIIKINDDRFLISWGEMNTSDEDLIPTDMNDPLTENNLHYIFIDGAGNPLSEEFIANAAFSDCKPVLKGSQIAYYASDDNVIDFYTIDVNTGDFQKRVYRIIGENADWSFENGTLTISGTGEISPNTGSNSPWASIKDQVEKIIIEQGITAIPDEAFRYFPNLKEVLIEDGLATIGKEAFAFCENLEVVTVPASVTEIGEDAFWSGYSWVGSGGHVVHTALYAPSGSYAETYAAENDIQFVAIASVNETGDVNLDGSVTIADTVLLQRYLIAQTDLDEAQFLTADLNLDQKVNAFDLVMLRQITLSLS